MLLTHPDSVTAVPGAWQEVDSEGDCNDQYDPDHYSEDLGGHAFTVIKVFP